MREDIGRLSDELARDPSSLAFVPLGEVLRRQGDVETAHKITLRGLERNPYHPDGHDLLARICLDRGDVERAMDEWDMVLRLLPGHVGAHKGLGFLCFQSGRMQEAESHLAQALAQSPEDAAIAGALAHVRSLLAGGDDGITGNGARAPQPAPAVGAVPPAPAARVTAAVPSATPSAPVPAQRTSDALRAPAEIAPPPAEALHDPRFLFADLLYNDDQTALLLDAEGLVLAGVYVAGEGHDVSQEIGAALSGVSDEALRATRHLDIGEWSSIVFQTQIAAVSMAPTRDGGLVVVASGQSTPLGLARRLLDQCTARAAQWLGGTA